MRFDFWQPIAGLGLFLFAMRQLESAHFMFNLTSDSNAFVFLTPLLALIAWIGISDPMYELVAFHSLFNMIGKALFFPFLRVLANFLNAQFAGKLPHASLFVSEASPGSISCWQLCAMPCTRLNRCATFAMTWRNSRIHRKSKSQSSRSIFAVS